jgi:hypothetical protein
MPQRIKLLVEVNLDPMEGTFSTAASALEYVGGLLSRVLSSYKPTVAFAGYAESFYEDFAMLVTEESKEVGGPFFMNERVIIGWYYITSTDPNKIDLCLPPHIFRRCFRWVEENINEKNYNKVQEIV